MGQVLQVVNRAWWDCRPRPRPPPRPDPDEDRAARPRRPEACPRAQEAALLDALRHAYLADRPEALELAADLGRARPPGRESLRAAGAAASAAAGGNRGYRPTADYLGLEYPPMTSLRDVAEGIPFIVLPDRSR